MQAFIYPKWAAVWRPDGLCEVYLADVTVIDLLRVHDLVRTGLPDETMRSLWHQARRIVARAELTGVRELLENPYLLWVNGRTGEVLSRWEAQESWSVVKDALTEAHHAA